MKRARYVILIVAAMLAMAPLAMAQTSGASAGSTGGVSGTGGPGDYFITSSGGDTSPGGGSSASPSYYNSSSNSDGNASVAPVGLGAGSNTTMGLNTNIGPYNTNLGLDASGAADEGLAATSRNAGLVKPVDPYAPNITPPASANTYGAGGMAGPDAASH